MASLKNNTDLKSIITYLCSNEDSGEDKRELLDEI